MLSLQCEKPLIKCNFDQIFKFWGSCTNPLPIRNKFGMIAISYQQLALGQQTTS